MTTVHPEEARPGVVNTDEEVLHTFSIDANMWEEYQKGSAHMHVYDGCPHFYRNVGCIPSPFHICCVVTCIPQACCSVFARCISPYVPQPLPEFEQEALVVTKVGLRGWHRTAEGKEGSAGAWDTTMGNPDAATCWQEPKYAGATWEPADLRWDEIQEIIVHRAKHGVGHCAPPGPSDTVHLGDWLRISNGESDPELGWYCGFGFHVPVCCMLCCSYPIPGYSRLEIHSVGKSPLDPGNPTPFNVVTVLQVPGLKEDADQVVQLITEAKEAASGASPTAADRVMAMDVAACRAALEKDGLSRNEIELISRRIEELEN